METNRFWLFSLMSFFYLFVRGKCTLVKNEPLLESSQKYVLYSSLNSHRESAALMLVD